MKYFPKLVGNRLYLSPMSVEDAAIYVKWLNDPTVSENIGMDTKITTLESEKEWLKENQNKYNFAIVLKESDKLIGNISLIEADLVHRNAVLGIFIGDDSNRGKGYGKEAIKLLLEYGFNNLNLNNIMLSVYSFNKRAIKVYESLGFKKFGTRHKSHYFKGKFYDEIQMEILKEEYSEIEPFIYV